MRSKNVKHELKLTIFYFCFGDLSRSLVMTACFRYLENAKEIQGSERLPTKISGCIIHSGFYEAKRKILFFLNHDQVINYNINLETI